MEDTMAVDRELTGLKVKQILLTLVGSEEDPATLDGKKKLWEIGLRSRHVEDMLFQFRMKLRANIKFGVQPGDKLPPPEVLEVALKQTSVDELIDTVCLSFKDPVIVG